MIGILVDGDAEAIALRGIVDRCVDGGCLTPLYADMQPNASPARIAGAASGRVELLRTRGAQRLVVILDLEKRSACPVTRARALREAFSKRWPDLPVCVAIKVLSFENWLVASPSSFKSMNARFNVSKAFEKAVAPNKADNVGDPVTLMNRIASGARYHKRKDAKVLAAKADLSELQANSRSFRRFLKCLNDPDSGCSSKRVVVA